MTVPAHAVPPRPSSDVSSAVGLVGALGLCGWILFCHFYPEVAPLLGLDPARGRRFLRFSYAGKTSDMAEALTRLAAWSRLKG